ncbi:hypothetical protein [Ornithinimicrobium tianjinense]|nr:hypothetical protein [Ornithinimicrobium tianjinense]
MSDQAFDQDQRSPSTGDVAKQETATVAHDAKEAGRSVASTTGEEAKAVLGEAKSQIASLYDGVRTDLRDQAGTQQGRVAEAMRGLAGELGQMADGAQQGGGMASGLVRQVSERMDGAATWLSDRGPEEVLDEVKRYARRNPGTFLGICALVGLVGGRLTRGLRDEQQDQAGSGYAAPPPAAPAYSPHGTTTTMSTSTRSTSTTYAVEPGVADAGTVPSYGGRPSADVPGDVPPVTRGVGQP